MSKCKTYRSEIAESAGGLSDGARAHVESCGACGEFRRVNDSLRQLVHGLERVEAPADFEFRLRARIATRKGGRGRTLFARRGPFTSYATVAAALCFMVISASLYFWQTQGRRPVDAQKSNSIVNNASESKQSPSKISSESSPTPSSSIASQSIPMAALKQTNGIKSRGGVLQRVGGISRVDEEQRTLRSNTFSESAAQVINRLKIPVNTSAEPLRVVLRDEQGAAHVVPMRTVSFGSQELLARETTGRRASVKNDEGVW